MMPIVHRRRSDVPAAPRADLVIVAVAEARVGQLDRGDLERSDLSSFLCFPTAFPVLLDRAEM
jgi:hypothetical protein